MKALGLLFLTLAAPAVAVRPHVITPHRNLERPIHNRTPSGHKEAPSARERLQLFARAGHHAPKS